MTSDEESASVADDASPQIGHEDWVRERPADLDRLGTLWLRWTDGGTDIHIHRVCAIIPHVSVDAEWPYIHRRPETGDRPTFTPVRDGEEMADDVQFQFIAGAPRELLRHVPLVIFTAAVVLGIGAEFTPHVDGISEMLPAFSGPDALLLGAYVLSLPIMLWLLSTVGIVEHREFPQAAFVYGLIAALVAGVVASVFFVTTASHPSQAPNTVVFVSGYLLTLLLGGQILYEGILRIEHLFVRIGQREDDIIGDTRAYREFLTDLHDALGYRGRIISPSRLFGVLFAAQFAIFWLIGDGPQNLQYGLGLAVNFGLNAVLATIAFQFLILIRYFNRLLNATGEYTGVNLRYEPFHVDGHGGFRDFGRFATRINLILTAAGLYLVYRLYVIGIRGLPVEGLMAMQDSIALTTWVLSFVGPVVAYAAIAGAWGYYSFWTMHAKMVRDKYNLARRYQGSERDVDRDRTPAAGDRIDSFDDSEGPAWAALRQAPTWPLDINTLASLISGNALPLVLPLLNFL